MNDQAPAAEFRAYTLEERMFLESRRHNRQMEYHTARIRDVVETAARYFEQWVAQPARERARTDAFHSAVRQIVVGNCGRTPQEQTEALRALWQAFNDDYADAETLDVLHRTLVRQPESGSDRKILLANHQQGVPEK